MELTGNTDATPEPRARTDWPQSSLKDWALRAWRAALAFTDWYSDHCRRIRAYMDLSRLGNVSLHAVLSDPESHDRILEGKPPRRCIRRTQRDR
jgi:hypothetical protein